MVSMLVLEVSRGWFPDCKNNQFEGVKVVDREDVCNRENKSGKYD
jgi:hypothetical protein